MIGETVADSPDPLTEIAYRCHFLIEHETATREEYVEELRAIITACERIQRERSETSERIERIEALTLSPRLVAALADLRDAVESAEAMARARSAPERPALRLVD